ncbi:MAG: ABC transporter ATP-binding protein [Candidatus Rokubacteria bacterium]|nr:ABC transporter ATP-binding protein [Candidatus Rokubacteria bacterium]
MSAPSAVIVVDNVAKFYGRVAAVRDVTLEVERGEVIGLLGPNGSGKTTLLRMLTGYLSPSSGRLRVAGYDTVREPMEARRRIGYVPESVPLYAHMRVREFLDFMARLRGLRGPEAAAAVARAAERVNLGEVMRAPIRTLSRGYRQRVAIAQALVHRPDVLILDEPTNGLDPRQIIETRSLIQALAGEHTVLMSSHILGEVEKIAGRVAILLRGRLLAIRAIADTPDLEALFLSLT